jgi:penicillin G amidase
MPQFRLVKFFNYTVAALLLLGLAAVWWVAWRPLPQTSGTLDAPVAQGVTVSRDHLGVPHIRAAGEDDLYFAQGFVTAQDRLFQMEALRRFSGGTLAEVFGPAMVEIDRESRRLRLRRLAEASYAGMNPRDRAAMAAYTRGVNHYISSHLNRLPVEFTLLRYQPRPWSVIDCTLIGLHMFRTLSGTWKDELLKRSMSQAGDPAKVDQLFPPRAGWEVQPGSNAWVVAGSRTASGKPLLSNDMHLEWSLPGIWYMAHLEAPGLEVAGVTLPGMPGVVAGHNRRIAWGITNLHYDVQDLYQEKFDDRSGRYLFRGQVEQARLEREVIRVKGAASVQFDNWVTRHGPLWVIEGNDRLALRWTAAQPGAFQFALLDVNRAGNWQEFTQAISRWTGPGSNFVYADVDGNIGYHGAGSMPIRRNYRGDLPVDGSSGQFEWDGFIPFDQLPAAYNPPQGIIVTANQNPFPPQFPYAVNGNFPSPYRAKQIEDRLLAKKGWKPEDLLRLQSDVYSGISHFIARAMVAAYDKRGAKNPSLEEAVGILRTWNGQMHRDQAAPFLVALAFQQLRTAVAENAAPGKGAAYEGQMASAVIERLFRERPEGWFRDYDETLLRALVDAVDEGRRIQGRDVTKWKYGQYLLVSINNPVLHQLPWIGSRYDITRWPMSGASTTVKQTTWRLGPSMRLNADLGDWENSLLNITIGQSGHALSSHYRDQWEHYFYGQSYPMPWHKGQAKDVLELRPVQR